MESTDCGFVCCDNLHPYSVFMDQLCLHSNMPFAFAEVDCVAMLCVGGRQNESLSCICGLYCQVRRIVGGQACSEHGWPT